MAEFDVAPRPSSRDRQLWSGPGPLVLASRSAIRRALLSGAGFSVEAVAANVDERSIERTHFGSGGSLDSLASALARAKALAVSGLRPDAFCLGADQTLSLEGQLLHKSRDMAEAARSLAELAGRAHRLTSAFCVARAGQALVVEFDYADLRMRPLDEAAIARYLDLAGPGVLSSVGAYQIEGLGMHLFDRIEGDLATILGMPMLKLLAWLRAERLISL